MGDSAPSDQLIPLNDTGSTISHVELAAQNSDYFASVIPQILWDATHDGRHFQDSSVSDQLRDVIRLRSDEQPVISAISSILERTCGSRHEFNYISFAMSCIHDLSVDQLLPYRPALKTLMEMETKARGSPQFASPLSFHAQRMYEFIQDRNMVWTPLNKFDDMAERSLQERVHTAEQMRPHIDGLLTWLQDTNWPVYPACVRQLARFPLLTVQGIRSAIEEYPTDGTWILNMLSFVEEHVPVGPLWEVLRAPVEAIMNHPVGDAEESGLSEYVPRWLGRIDPEGVDGALRDK